MFKKFEQRVKFKNEVSLPRRKDFLNVVSCWTMNFLVGYENVWNVYLLGWREIQSYVSDIILYLRSWNVVVWLKRSVEIFVSHRSSVKKSSSIIKKSSQTTRIKPAFDYSVGCNGDLTANFGPFLLNVTIKHHISKYTHSELIFELNFFFKTWLFRTWMILYSIFGYQKCIYLDSLLEEMLRQPYLDFQWRKTTMLQHENDLNVDMVGQKE